MKAGSFSHHTVRVNGIQVHYVRQVPDNAQARMPLVLLHGWPEFWYVWHKAGNDARLKQIADGPQPRAAIDLPTRFLCGKHDAVLSSDWVEGLEDYFSNAVIETCEDAGHFVFCEQPDRANAAITSFFLQLAGAADGA